MSGAVAPDNSPRPLMDAGPSGLSNVQEVGAVKADGPRQGISKTNEGRPVDEPAPLRDAQAPLRDEPFRAPTAEELQKALMDLATMPAEQWIADWEKNNGPMTDGMKTSLHGFKKIIDDAVSGKSSNSEGNAGNEIGTMSPELDKAIAGFAGTLGQSWDMQMQSAFARFMSSTKSKATLATADIG